jgi:hypothetical protein
MKIEYVVTDEGNCTVEVGTCEFNMHFHQRTIGWLSQGWDVRVWPYDEEEPS